MEKPRIQIRVDNEVVKQEIIDRAESLHKNTQQYILDLIADDMNNKTSNKKILSEIAEVKDLLLILLGKLDLKLKK